MGFQLQKSPANE